MTLQTKTLSLFIKKYKTKNLTSMGMVWLDNKMSSL